MTGFPERTWHEYHKNQGEMSCYGLFDSWYKLDVMAGTQRSSIWSPVPSHDLDF